MIYKHKYPFASGCTSYVVADNILPNVEQVASRFDDVELLCFESPDRSYYIDEKTVERLADVGHNNDLSYTVHCPIDHKAGSGDLEERERFLSGFLRIVELTLPLKPVGWILHLEGLSSNPSSDETASWMRRVKDICERITTKIPAEMICLENLGYPPEFIETIAENFGLSYCVDVGHLWRYGHDWKGYFRRVLSKTKVIHLHGVEGKTDHISLERHDPRQLKEFIDSVLREYDKVVTLELFSESELTESMRVLEKLWAK